MPWCAGCVRLLARIEWVRQSLKREVSLVKIDGIRGKSQVTCLGCTLFIRDTSYISYLLI